MLKCKYNLPFFFFKCNMALSQPGSAVEWWVFILMQRDPQTPSHSHSPSHWASRQSEAYFGLMCCQAPSLRFLRPPRHRGDPPSLPPSRSPAPAPVCFSPQIRNPRRLPDQESPCPVFVFVFVFFQCVAVLVRQPRVFCWPSLCRAVSLRLKGPSHAGPSPISPRETITTSTLAATLGPLLLPPSPPSGAHRLRGLHCSATFIES